MTFSQLVDAMVQEHNAPDLKSTIISFVNQTIREVHSAKPGNTPILYGANLQEDTLTADADVGFTWDIPNPQNFQKLAAVRYDAFGSGRDAYAKERVPSRMYLESRHDKIYYRTGMSFAFAGYGGTGSTISLAWHEAPRRLTYYAVADRPAVWNDVTQAFTYKDSYAGTDNLKAEARVLSTNWLLDRWEELIMQGVRTKIYAKRGDQLRGTLAYSSFESMRPDLVAAESWIDGSDAGESN